MDRPEQADLDSLIEALVEAGTGRAKDRLLLPILVASQDESGER